MTHAFDIKRAETSVFSWKKTILVFVPIPGVIVFNIQPDVEHWIVW